MGGGKNLTSCIMNRWSGKENVIVLISAKLLTILYKDITFGSLVVACLQPFKQSPESGDSKRIAIGVTLDPFPPPKRKRDKAVLVQDYSGLQRIQAWIASEII